MRHSWRRGGLGCGGVGEVRWGVSFEESRIMDAKRVRRRARQVAAARRRFCRGCLLGWIGCSASS